VEGAQATRVGSGLTSSPQLRSGLTDLAHTYEIPRFRVLCFAEVIRIFSANISSPFSISNIEEENMPEKETIQRAKKDAREGKSPSTQAGEFVREEIHHIREGKHGARSAKQAIAIGLSKARRAGVKLPTPKNASAETREQASRDSAKAGTRKRSSSSKRARATRKALKREPRAAASTTALSRQAKASARKGGPVSLKSAARRVNHAHSTHARAA
jgi:hypothetical protein